MTTPQTPVLLSLPTLLLEIQGQVASPKPVNQTPFSPRPRRQAHGPPKTTRSPIELGPLVPTKNQPQTRPLGSRISTQTSSTSSPPTLIPPPTPLRCFESPQPGTARSGRTGPGLFGRPSGPERKASGTWALRGRNAVSSTGGSVTVRGFERSRWRGGFGGGVGRNPPTSQVLKLQGPTPILVVWRPYIYIYIYSSYRLEAIATRNCLARLALETRLVTTEAPD